MEPCLYDLLRRQAELTPDAPALLAPGRAALGYGALLRQAETVAAVLAGYGVGPADRIAVVLPNGPDMAACFLAVAACAVCAPLNPAYREPEFALYCDDLAPRAAIVADGPESPIRAVAAARGIPVIELASESAAPAGEFALRGPVAAIAEPRFAGPDDIALVLHTSGTTSRPKMVPLSQRNLCRSAANIAASLALGPHDRCLNAMPLFHIHGLVGAVLATISSGGSIVCPPGFMAAPFFGWLEEFAPTWYTAVPTIHRDIVARGAQLAAPPRHGSLRFVRSCSAPMPLPLIAEVEGFLGVPVVEAYGMTEASHQIAINPLPPGRRKPGSVGLPAGTEVAAMDGAGALLPAGESGEIVVRGPGVTAGYADNPEANAKAFADGWFRTGDQGHVDADGYVFLTGRTKEIINRGGAKIAPREVDDVLTAHPAVAEAIAFAMPDPRLGEAVAAAVVLRPGAALDERELRDFVGQRLADYKQPHRIVFLDALPKGPTGKLQRIGLAEKLGIAGAADGEAATFAAARTPTEAALAALWRQYLRLDRIGVHDNFFDAGGDSLSASLMVMEIERVLAVGLSVGELFEAPTIAELAARLDDSRTTAQRPRLARVQPRGERPPFFCIGAGPTTRALGLRLAPDQPFLGPQYPDFSTLPHPCQLEDIAAYHVATIRAAQPAGPYFLGGWCVDGLVAYEVGRQLRAQGERVGLLVMFDVPSPRVPAEPERRAAQHGRLGDAVERVRLHLRVLADLPWRERPAYSWGRLQAAFRATQRRLLQLHYDLRLRLKMPAVVRNDLAVQHRAAQLYRLQPTDSPILVVRRTLRPGGRQRDAAAGWDRLARGRLEVIEIPGAHRDMFLEPQVGTTAARLKDALAQAQGAAAPQCEMAAAAE